MPAEPYLTHADDGTLVLVDSDGAAVARVVAKRNCTALLALNEERVRHFLQRAHAHRAESLCLVVLDVDDPRGGELAGKLMPGHDWQACRDRGERPVACGLVRLGGMIDYLETLEDGASSAFMWCPDDALPIVVMTDGAVMTTFRMLPKGADHAR